MDIYLRSGSTKKFWAPHFDVILTGDATITAPLPISYTFRDADLNGDILLVFSSEAYSAVPEPSAFGLLGLCIIGTVVRRSRNHSH
jgi:hypothetical protein